VSQLFRMLWFHSAVPLDRRIESTYARDGAEAVEVVPCVGRIQLSSRQRRSMAAMHRCDQLAMLRRVNKTVEGFSGLASTALKIDFASDTR
jgi:hypothetical protein